MKPGYEIRPYSPRYRAQILELQRHLWGSDLARNDAYFSWKYEQNPYASRIRIYLAFQGERLVGMRGFYGSRWEAGVPRAEVPIWCPDDLVIAPEHRDRGLFTAIMNTALDDLAAQQSGFALSTGSRDLTVLGSLTMGWKRIVSLGLLGLSSKHYRRLHRWQQRLRQMRFLWRMAGARWLNPRSRFDRLDRSVPPSPDLATIRVSRDPDVDGMAALVEELGYDGRVRHVRDAQYFAWRFRNPLREYRFLYAGGSRLTGYLVLHRSVSNRDATSPIHLADWEASSSAVAEALLDAALQSGQFPAIVTWGAALPAGTRALLESKGFQPIQRARAARGTYCGLVRPLRSGIPPAQWTLGGRNLLDPGSWDLRMLYSMVG
jgi:GNAT superfamily N-acetyltransferase